MWICVDTHHLDILCFFAEVVGIKLLAGKFLLISLKSKFPWLYD